MTASGAAANADSAGPGDRGGVDNIADPAQIDARLDDPRARRLFAAFHRAGRRTIRLDAYQQLFAEVDPSSAGSAARRQTLLSLLTDLSAAGAVVLSGTRDRSARPALPTQLTCLTVPAPVTGAARARARATVWRPQLAWALEGGFSSAQIDTLVAVNSWLRGRGSGTDVVPSRERSLEIFGHEKTLDGLRGGALFRPGRLDQTLLRIYRSHPPLPSIPVGDGSVLLVVENEDTFTSLRSAAAADPGPLRAIAWGAGAAFEASIRSVADLPAIAEIRYFGDLDVVGLRIPRNADRTSTLEGLPRVRPARSLYRLMLEHGDVQPHGKPTVGDTTGTSWLADADLVARAANLLPRGRLPQESVGTRLLGQHPGWVHEL